MIIKISNNPINPKLGNEGDTRHLEIVACEFFENGGYKQVLVAGILTTKDGNGKTTGQDKCVANSNDGTFDYNSLKAAAEGSCTFNAIRNVVKANACPNVTATIVAAFDAQKLFD